MTHRTIFAALTAAVLLPVSGLAAQAPGAYYVATPVAAPAKASLITRSTPWRLQGTAYVANKAPERDAVLCQLIAQRAGKLAGFSVNGAAFDAETLDACNAKAK